MEALNFVWVGAAFGFIASAWRNVKTIAWRVCSYFIASVEFTAQNAQGSDAAFRDAIVDYLVENCKMSKNYDRVYTIFNEYANKDGHNRRINIPVELLGRRTTLFWKGWVPILLKCDNSGGGSTTTTTSGGGGSNPAGSGGKPSGLMYLRGTLDLDKIVSTAIDKLNERRRNNDALWEEVSRRFFIRYVPAVDKAVAASPGSSPNWHIYPNNRIIGYSPDQIGRPNRKTLSAIGQLVFPEEVWQVIDKIKRWKVSRSWYEQRGIPWKSGLLLYGPPGTGKTALTRAFAEDLDLPIFVYNLAEINQTEFIKVWQDMQQYAPCIALCEDFDTVFHGREFANRDNGEASMTAMMLAANQKGGAVSPGNRLTFGTFLNCLDGVDRSEGIFTIITTNDISKIDAALGQPREIPGSTKKEFISSRPGRIDNAVELTFMTDDCKETLAYRLLHDYPDAYAKIMNHIKSNPGLEETPAQFQKRCVDLALLYLYDNHIEQFTEAAEAVESCQENCVANEA